MAKKLIFDGYNAKLLSWVSKLMIQTRLLIGEERYVVDINLETGLSGWTM